ncbi:MAG TPA: ATP-binding protein [Rhizomicrobium sp.]|nr:ATP-binding protein [Rhizomicrobium sp.]
MPEPTPDRGATILIVDDDDILRAIMRAELEAAHFTVVEAADGEEACAVCWSNPPDLVVADVIMPRMDGFTLCRKLRAHPLTEFIPILQATALDDLASIEKAYEAGATAFVCKPINWNLLRHHVRYMLRSARAFESARALDALKEKHEQLIAARDAAERAFEELRRNQEALVAARNAAEAANRAKTNFLANMSHELRTPLNAIIGFSTIMRDGMFGPMPPKYAEYAAMVCDSGTHLRGVIGDILDLAKAEANVLETSEDDVDIDRVVSLVGTIIADLADRSGVTYRAVIEPRLPNLRADPARLQQILINLLGNAVKFTPRGGSAALFVETAPDGGLQFRIVDSGIGIPEDKLELAMSPFGQVDTGLARKYEGTGLGLPLTKRLVEMQGGALAITSEPGHGTTVTVRFPAAADGQLRRSAAG